MTSNAQCASNYLYIVAEVQRCLTQKAIFGKGHVRQRIINTTFKVSRMEN